jgi:hypothetical protein
MVSVPVRSGTPEDACRVGLSLAALYRGVFTTPAAFHTGALLAVFPDLDSTVAPTFIDGGHALLKPQFVAQGLMLGEFHPRSSVASVRNPDLHVMRCPVPMFAVRALSRHDLAFLDTPHTAPDLRARYLRHALTFLGDQLPDHQQARIRAELANSLEQPR